jgi:hypoxanthine phosphoribosyltransferase
MNVFDYVNEILVGKKILIVDDETEKGYSSYIVNRALAQHQDCVSLANMMNHYPNLDNKLQFLFLINTVRSKKRPFNKWAKAEKIEELENIKEFYGYSDDKAREALKLLDDEQIQEIKKQTDKGGLRN